MRLLILSASIKLFTYVISHVPNSFNNRIFRLQIFYEVNRREVHGYSLFPR